MNNDLPRCDKCESCYHAKSKKQTGFTYYCALTDRDVGQSHFGMNSPKCCPKRKLNKSDKKILNEMQASGAITISKLPDIILLVTILYPPLEDWDFERN